MSTQERGFTLVELIVVIVILGILAATALPRFVNLTGEAKAASMKGLAGSMSAAVELVRGKWYAVGSTAATTVTLGDGNTVAVGTTGTEAGVPTAAGILTAAGITAANYTCTGAAPVSCTPVGGPTGCTVEYAPATGVVTVNATTALCQ